MGESRSSKETRARLEERDRQAAQQQQQLMAKAIEQTPLEKRREESLIRDVDYFDQAVPDYSTAPRGMIDDTVFQRAALNRLRERTATGATQMGAYGANPNLMALNREHANLQTAEMGAGAYAGQLAARRAEALGGSDAMTSLAVQRALSLAGMGNQNAQVAQTNLAQFRPAPSGWAQFGMAALQGAAGLGAAYLGRGRG